MAHVRDKARFFEEKINDLNTQVRKDSRGKEIPSQPVYAPPTQNIPQIVSINVKVATPAKDPRSHPRLSRAKIN